MVSTNQLVGTMILQVWNLPSKKTGSEIGDEHRADAWWKAPWTHMRTMVLEYLSTCASKITQFCR